MGNRDEDWEGNFRGLLGEMEERIIWRRKEEEKDLEKEEVKRVIKGLKDGKSLGVDGVLNEVWKYGGLEVEGWAWKVCNRVWKEKGWPKEWKEESSSADTKKRSRKQSRTLQRNYGDADAV